MASTPILWIEICRVILPGIFGCSTQRAAGSWIGEPSPLPRWSSYEYSKKTGSCPEMSKS